MNLKVGITGGIGSGKSTVCNVFKALGIPVYHADDAARSITDTNPEVVAQIKQLFGAGLYETGQLNRPQLAAIVFNNPDKLVQLNSIVHPAVRKQFATWYAANQHAPYILQEAAILFESGVYKLMDTTLLVSASAETRISRVVKRDGVSAADVEARMQNQWTEEQRLALAAHVILNEGDSPIIAQVLALDKQLKNLAV
jgi:dephospho-CoA kinase